MIGPNNGVLVIDHGSVNVRAGLSTFKFPHIQFPSAIGRIRNQDVLHGLGNQHIGDQINAYRNVVNIRHPIDRGIVRNWDDIRLIWTYLFRRMNIRSEDHPVLLSECPLIPNKDREQMTQIMFEDYNIPAFYIANQSVLAILATGTRTGLALDIGGGITHSVPVYEGYALPHATNTLNIGGIDLANHMVSLLAIRGHDLNTPSGRDIANNMKETHSFVAQDFNQQVIDANLNRDYALPDGNVVTLASERFFCPEALFSPQMIGVNAAGIHHMVHNSIDRCDPDLQSLLKSNIVLAGGTSLIPGLQNRVQIELNALFANQDAHIRDLVAPLTPDILPWIGGSNLASFESFDAMCISRAEYNDSGAGIVRTRCF